MTLRCHCRGGMSSINSNLQTVAYDKFAQTGVKLAKLSQPDPDFVSIPRDQKPAKSVVGMFDRKVVSLGVDELVQYAIDAIDTASLSPDHVIEGGINHSVSGLFYMSCFGAQFTDRYTSVSGGVGARVERSGDVATYYEFDVDRRLKDFDIVSAARKAGERVQDYLGSRKVKTADLPVILDPRSAYGTLPGILVMGAIAEGVQRNRSYFCDKLGQQVAVEEITMTDDARIPWGLGSSPCDGEGTPHKRLTVVDKGVLRSYLHNSYTANKAGVETTGHAALGYARGISPTNIEVEKGDWALGEMIRDCGEGIYVELGGFFADPVTGDSSTTLDFAFKIEKGELAYPVKNTMIGINVLEGLRNIDAVSKETREEPGRSVPGIRISKAKISGGA